MPHIIFRIATHSIVYLAFICSVYILHSLNMMCMKIHTAVLLTSLFAIIQAIVEIIFNKIHQGDSKTKLFKIMALRSTKFLLYLIISLAFILSFPHEQTPISFLVISLFTVYTVFEIVFIIKRSQ